jgi:hypothetical protein
MRKPVLALLLALACTAVARADVYAFAQLRLARGYQGPVTVDVLWGDRTARDVAAVTGTVVVYMSSPAAGGEVLFTKAVVPAGGANPVNRMTFSVTTADTAALGTYYAEITLTEGTVIDVLHGVVVIEGG